MGVCGVWSGWVGEWVGVGGGGGGGGLARTGNADHRRPVSGECFECSRRTALVALWTVFAQCCISHSVSSRYPLQSRLQGHLPSACATRSLDPGAGGSSTGWWGEAAGPPPQVSLGQPAARAMRLRRNLQAERPRSLSVTCMLGKNRSLEQAAPSSELTAARVPGCPAPCRWPAHLQAGPSGRGGAAGMSRRPICLRIAAWIQ